jgi:sulfur-carrier protein adenylyltransferase/sulfurtransferase
MSSPVERVLDLARWAPSGDNTQPWRFEIVGDDHVLVHGFDTREECLYDIDGRPSQMAIGALVETLRVAASGFGLRAEVNRLDSPETRPLLSVRLVADRTVSASSLARFIKVRTVQRRPLKTRPLSVAEKHELEASVGADYTVLWLEGWRRRLAVARLLFASAKIRLTTPEAFEVHRRVIEWDARFSADRIPDQAVGLDALSTRLMRWAMQDWRRVQWLNTYLGGTIMPRTQLDFLPGIACAAHFLLVARNPPGAIEDYMAAGGAMQRFWLTATSLGLQVQPEMTPLIFSMYAREERPFSVEPQSLGRAHAVRRRLRALAGEYLDTSVFMGRIGAGPPASSRSTRRDLDQLMLR